MSQTWLWVSPVWTRHLAALADAACQFILVGRDLYTPHAFKARVGHADSVGRQVLR